MPGTLQQLTRYESLLALGLSLVMAGLILRGFAASSRRDRARRRQHLRDERKPGATGRGGAMELEPGWLERNLGMLANSTLVAGLALAVAAFFRK